MNDLTVTRVLAVDVGRAWRLWTDPELLARWFWPPTWDTTCQIDLREGGRYRVASELKAMAVSGEYVVIVEHELLLLTWQWDGEDLVTRVTVTFAPEGETSTTLTVRHERFLDAVDRDNHLQGWNDCLDRLVSTTAG